MPLPSPKGNESRSAFVARCMKSGAARSEFPDQKQRVAVCNSQWRQAKKQDALDLSAYLPETQEAVQAIAESGLGAVVGPTAKADASDSEARREIVFKAADHELQVVYGEVYAPIPIPDSDRDVADEDFVRQMAWDFISKGQVRNIDVEHNGEFCGAYVVESFLARKNDDLYTPGAWVLGVHIPDAKLWQAVKDEEINAFSLEAFVRRKEDEVELFVPDEMVTSTSERDGHQHVVIVKFDEQANVVGGDVLPLDPDGNTLDHGHRLATRSMTTKADGDGHTHGVNIMSDLMALQETESEE